MLTKLDCQAIRERAEDASLLEHTILEMDVPALLDTVQELRELLTLACNQIDTLADVKYPSYVIETAAHQNAETIRQAARLPEGKNHADTG